MLFPCSKLVFYLQFTEEIFLFSRFYKLNNEKNCMCMEVLFGINRLYIKLLVRERDSTNSRTVEF